MRIKHDLALAPGRSGAPQNACLIPQNFLIEERLDPARAVNYAAELPSAGPTNFVEWDRAHKRYLDRHVFVKSSPVHDYHVVSRDNPVLCPETFRASIALLTFQETDLDTDFVRLVPVADLAGLLNQNNEDRIFSLGKQVVADPSEDNPARQELSLILQDAYSRCDHRPIFAAFYEDFEFLRDPADISWPDLLRDRLGFYHINQWQKGGLPRPVFLFKYSVRDIPRHPGKSDRRPIAVPVVLDHRLSEAFCPAPRELDRGRVLNLKSNAVEEPAREVLHLFMPMQVEHLFRVGLVTTNVPDDLAEARRDHLLWLQLLAERDNYGII